MVKRMNIVFWAEAQEFQDIKTARTDTYKNIPLSVVEN
jgi:hypothetical protein